MVATGPQVWVTMVRYVAVTRPGNTLISISIILALWHN